MTRIDPFSLPEETAEVARLDLDSETDALNRLVEVVAEHGPAWVVAACKAFEVEHAIGWLQSTGIASFWDGSPETRDIMRAQLGARGFNEEGVLNV